MSNLRFVKLAVKISPSVPGSIEADNPMAASHEDILEWRRMRKYYKALGNNCSCTVFSTAAV
jgi:hypothetical protein